MAKGSGRKHKSKKAEPAPPSRLLLRVHSAKGLPHVLLSQGLYCKLYVGETAMTHGSQRGGLFCKKKTAVHTEAIDADDSGESTETHRIFRTKTIEQPEKTEEPVVWDENFDVLVPEATKDILSVRVKSKQRLYPFVFGACAIPLKQLKVGHMWDQWVPIMKGNREVASLRVQLLLSPLQDPFTTSDRTRVLQADIKTALAANHAADDAIARLVLSATFKKARDGSDDHPDDHDDDDHVDADHTPVTSPKHAVATAAV